ncbi:hypothetical protein BCR42DRAFT_404379, partial [Absidia repens]
MKRRAICMLLLLIVLFLTLSGDHIFVDGQPESELWRPDLMDELALDEWPVGEEDVNANSDLEPMNTDEMIYEMEALMAERREQAKVDGINEKEGLDEDEEDDVDQDDYEEEEEEEEDVEDNTGPLEQSTPYQQFDSSSGEDDKESQSLTDETTVHPNDELFLISAEPVSSSPKATSKLQQQEELDLEVLDRSIVDTFLAAVDTINQDKSSRFIPLNENTPTNDAAITEASVEKTTFSSFFSLFLTSGLHISLSWSFYWILGILLSLIILSYRKSREHIIRDYYHLPSYSVYKQKSSV